MNEILIQADELSVGYDKTLIENISFRIKAGEIMTLTGLMPPENPQYLKLLPDI